MGRKDMEDRMRLGEFVVMYDEGQPKEWGLIRWERGKPPVLLLHPSVKDGLTKLQIRDERTLQQVSVKQGAVCC